MSIQKEISDWATATFGDAGSNMRVATRANEEMAELVAALSIDDNHAKAPEEMADVVIIFYRLAERLGVDLHEQIKRKMEVNRARTWERDGSGHGYHRKHTQPAKEEIAMPKMRAKFVVDAVVQSEQGTETLHMRAIHKEDGYDSDGLDENNTYSKFTPNADLQMQITNPALVGQFHTGQQFYVDFTLA